VLETDYPDFEVIFVDNGSTDLSANLVRENYGSAIRVVRNDTNLGFSEGFNTGMRSSRGKYLALISNDMKVDSNWLNPIIRSMETDQQIGLAGFKRLAYGTQNVLDGIGGDLYLCGRVKVIGNREIDKGQYDMPIEDLDYIGGAIVVRRELIKEIGLFDPDYIIFSEDCDLCYRIRKKGYKVVYIPHAIIWHKGQATLNAMDPETSHVTYMSERSRIRFALIHFTAPRVLSTFLIDCVWFFLTSFIGKKALAKAYVWNIKNVATTLKRRARYGPSPPYRCKSPIIPFRLSGLKKRLGKI
jgi:GT2 family glycosyltransferase